MWLADAKKQTAGSASIEEVMVMAAVAAWLEEARKPSHVRGVWLVMVDKESDLESLKTGGGPKTTIGFISEDCDNPELSKFIAEGSQQYDVETEFVILGYCQDTGLRARVNVPLAANLMFESDLQRKRVVENAAVAAASPPPAE